MSAYSKARDRMIAGKVMARIDTSDHDVVRMAADHYAAAIAIAEKGGCGHYKEVQKWRDEETRLRSIVDAATVPPEKRANVTNRETP